jgi:hypothetical protein
MSARAALLTRIQQTSFDVETRVGMFDHGSDHIAIEPVAAPKICSGDPGADETPMVTSASKPNPQSGDRVALCSIIPSART